MINYAQEFSQKETPQSEKIPGSKQVENSAGGYSFQVDHWTRLERFLILGSEGGSYYANERNLTIENCESALKCIEENPRRTIDMIVDVSDSGRAPKNDQAIFLLALVSASKNLQTRDLAYAALPKVCRIGTHLFQFIEGMESQRGWSRGMRTAVANWYKSKSIDNLAEQLTKYQQRNGWSHRDVLRLAHPKGTPAQSRLFAWSVGKLLTDAGLPKAIQGFQKAFESKDAKPKEAASIIIEYKLPRECVPTEWLVHAEVWEALLDNMPMTAMIRNLGNMTKCELLVPLSASSKLVIERLQDRALLKKQRIHPMTILTAMKIYAQGRGMRGSGIWTPVQSIVDALDEAFYLSFGNVTPTGKSLHLALDVSGSMDGSHIAGSPLTAREGSAAMALITARTEKDYFITAFQDKMVEIAITPRMRLDDVIEKISDLPFGRTDCAQPILYSAEQKIKNDAFVVYTDSETWAGNIHPTQALRQYRTAYGIPAKLVVVGMVSNGFTIADPDDSGMLDVVGFDSAAPGVISGFIRS